MYLFEKLLREYEGSEHWYSKILVAVKYPCSRIRLAAEIKRTPNSLYDAIIAGEVNLALNLIYTKGVDLERVIESSDQEFILNELSSINQGCFLNYSPFIKSLEFNF